jgi:steroid delta-isomerase-like uncharacterized protein
VRQWYSRRGVPMTDKDAIERQRAIVATHIGAENAHDWDAVADTFVQDDRAFYDVVPISKSFTGIEGVRGFYAAISAALPDMRVDVKAEYDCVGCSVREVVISGTHLGDYMGVGPTGNHVRVDLAAFYLFDEKVERLIAERIYFDQATVLRQMQKEAETGVSASVGS